MFLLPIHRCHRRRWSEKAEEPIAKTKVGALQTRKEAKEQDGGEEEEEEAEEVRAIHWERGLVVSHETGKPVLNEYGWISSITGTTVRKCRLKIVAMSPNYIDIFIMSGI